MNESKQNILKNTLKPAFCYLGDLNELLKQRGDKPELPIESLKDFNKTVWGFKRKQLYTIGSYTSHGKSSFCLQLSRDFVKQGLSVIYLSLEMTITRCLERLLCQEYKIPNTELFVGRYANYQNEINKFEEESKKWRLVITDCIGYTWQEIDNLISKLNTKPDVIFLDYAQMTKRTAKTAKDDYDEYIKHFREMAIRHNFCAILVSQIGRSSKTDGTKDPQLHHLSGSSLFEVHSDSVILLKWNYRDTNDEKDFHKYTIYISKSRDGATGYSEIYFKPDNYLFYEVEKTEPEPGWQDEKE